MGDWLADILDDTVGAAAEGAGKVIGDVTGAIGDGAKWVGESITGSSLFEPIVTGGVKLMAGQFLGGLGATLAGAGATAVEAATALAETYPTMTAAEISEALAGSYSAADIATAVYGANLAAGTVGSTLGAATISDAVSALKDAYPGISNDLISEALSGSYSSADIASAVYGMNPMEYTPSMWPNTLDGVPGSSGTPTNGIPTSVNPPGVLPSLTSTGGPVSAAEAAQAIKSTWPELSSNQISEMLSGSYSSADIAKVVYGIGATSAQGGLLSQVVDWVKANPKAALSLGSAGVRALAGMYGAKAQADAYRKAQAAVQASTTSALDTQERIRQENLQLLEQAKAAGLDIYDKNINEIKQLIPQLNTQQADLAESIKKLYAPARDLGLTAIPALKQLITRPDMRAVWDQYAPALPSYGEYKKYASLSPEADPLYQWQLKKSTDQLNTRLAKMGLTNSGAGIQAYDDMVAALNADAATRAYQKFKDLVTLESQMESTAYGRKYGAIVDATNIGTNANNAIAGTEAQLSKDKQANAMALINALLSTATGKANLHVGSATNATGVNTNAGNQSTALYNNLGDNLGSIAVAEGQSKTNTAQTLGAIPFQAATLYDTVSRQPSVIVNNVPSTGGVDRTINYAIPTFKSSTAGGF